MAENMAALEKRIANLEENMARIENMDVLLSLRISVLERLTLTLERDFIREFQKGRPATVVKEVSAAEMAALLTPTDPTDFSSDSDYASVSD